MKGRHTSRLPRRWLRWRRRQADELLTPWGERWETGVPATPILVDVRDQRPVRDVRVLSHDGRELAKSDLIWALPEDVVDTDPLLRAAE